MSHILQATQGVEATAAFFQKVVDGDDSRTGARIAWVMDVGFLHMSASGAQNRGEYSIVT